MIGLYTKIPIEKSLISALLDQEISIIGTDVRLRLIPEYLNFFNRQSLLTQADREKLNDISTNLKSLIQQESLLWKSAYDIKNFTLFLLDAAVTLVSILISSMSPYNKSLQIPPIVSAALLTIVFLVLGAGLFAYHLCCRITSGIMNTPKVALHPNDTAGNVNAFFKKYNYHAPEAKLSKQEIKEIFEDVCTQYITTIYDTNCSEEHIKFCKDDLLNYVRANSRKDSKIGARDEDLNDIESFLTYSQSLNNGTSQLKLIKATYFWCKSDSKQLMSKIRDKMMDKMKSKLEDAHKGLSVDGKDALSLN